MVNDIAVQDFVNAIKEPPTETVTSYNGVVSKIDKEGTAWVRVQGSNIETPTASSYVKVALGDKVSLNWRNNKLYIDGNYTDPSIGEGELDKVAVKIKAKLKKELEEEKEEEGGEGTIVAIWQEYNMSQYRTTPFRQADGYSWSETIWPYVRGLYMWIRYVYQYSDGTIEYGEPKFDMTNQAIAEANEAATNAANAASTASGIASAALEASSEKRRVFNSQPTPPYDLNDLWFDGAHGKVYLCTTARATGSFSSSDWTLYSEDVSNYFWHDSSGAHVSDTPPSSGGVTTGNSQTIASTGTVMMRNGKLVTSWTGSSSSDAALNFYDCDTTTVGDGNHLVASYAKAGITQYINNNKTIALTPSALSFFDPTDGETPEAIFGSGGVNLYSGGKLSASLESGAQTFYAADGITKVAQFSGDGVTFYDSDDSPMVKLRADTFNGYTRAQFINDTYAYDSTIGLYSTPTTAQLSLGAEDVGILLYCSSSNKFVRVTADDLSVSGYYASSGYKLLTVTREMIKDNLSIAAGSYNDSITKTLSKTGYTPIGIVGHNIRNASDTGMNGSHCFLFRCYIDGTTLRAGIRNKGSNEAIIRLDLEVLWIATTQGI